jgi:hypothetical protein
MPGAALHEAGAVQAALLTAIALGAGLLLALIGFLLWRGLRRQLPDASPRLTALRKVLRTKREPNS